MEFALLALPFACLALFLRGAFLLAMRPGRRQRGLWIMLAAPVLLFAGALVLMEVEARDEGWTSFTQKSDAKRAGVTDPVIWQAQEAARQEAAEKAAAEQAEEAARAAAAEEAAKAQEAAEFREQGFHCLSAWDGSNADFVRQIVAQLRDPDSFEHVETRIAKVKDGTHATFMTYRARNGFGGYNVAIATASVSTETCLATVVSTE